MNEQAPLPGQRHGLGRKGNLFFYVLIMFCFASLFNVHSLIGLAECKSFTSDEVFRTSTTVVCFAYRERTDFKTYRWPGNRTRQGSISNNQLVKPHPPARSCVYIYIKHRRTTENPALRRNNCESSWGRRILRWDGISIWNVFFSVILDLQSMRS